jgi:lantibiotic modifying enzyme
MLALLAEYPSLARRLVETVDSWTANTLEMLQRLSTDWAEIESTFSPETDPGQLVEIQEGAGDFHEGGRSVTILAFQSGLKLVYKPRAMKVDAHFRETIDWCNAHGFQPAFQHFPMLVKNDYGWCAFISPATCIQPEEVTRFYQRLGGYLALLHVLEATDFHAENLIHWKRLTLAVRFLKILSCVSVCSRNASLTGQLVRLSMSVPSRVRPIRLCLLP